MLMEYLAAATLAERRKELEHSRLVAFACKLNPPVKHRVWNLASPFAVVFQFRARRAARAASALGHSLSTIE
jgi:hypothetical protein